MTVGGLVIGKRVRGSKRVMGEMGIGSQVRDAKRVLSGKTAMKVSSRRVQTRGSLPFSLRSLLRYYILSECW